MMLQKSFIYADLNAQRVFLIIINVENSCAASYFVETGIIFFRILWWIESSKEKQLL